MSLHIAGTHEGGEQEDWAYAKCRRMPSSALVRLTCVRDGPVATLNRFAYDSLGVNDKLADSLTKIAGSDIQLLRCDFVGDSDLWLLNATSLRDCIDFDRSIVEIYDPCSTKTPVHKRGSIRHVQRLVLRPESVGQAAVFRLRGWMIPLVISSAVRDALQGDAERVGLGFSPVSMECDAPGELFYYDEYRRQRTAVTLDAFCRLRDQRMLDGAGAYEG